MNRTQIVREIRRRCNSFGVRMELSPDEMVKWTRTSKVSGFFDSSARGGPKLACGRCVSEEAFLGVLLHEYSHVTQWVENCTIWQEDERWTAKYGIDEWLGTGKKCSEGMKKAYAVRRDLEADCERRTVRLIKEMRAPINLSKYISASNSYIHFYNTIPVTNAWYRPDRTPYKTPEVRALFNSKKIDDDFSKTPKKQFKALLTCADLRS